MNRQNRGRSFQYNNVFPMHSNLAWLYPDARYFYNHSNRIYPSRVLRNPMEFSFDRNFPRSRNNDSFSNVTRASTHSINNAEYSLSNQTIHKSPSEDVINTKRDCNIQSDINTESTLNSNTENTLNSNTEAAPNSNNVATSNSNAAANSKSNTLHTSNCNTEFISNSNTEVTSNCNTLAIQGIQHDKPYIYDNVNYDSSTNSEASENALKWQSNMIDFISHLSKKHTKLSKKPRNKKKLKIKNQNVYSTLYHSSLEKEVKELRTVIEGIANTLSIFIPTAYSINKTVNEIKEEQIKTDESITTINKSLLYLNETLINNGEDLQQVISSSSDDLAESICSQIRPLILHITEIKNCTSTVNESIKTISDAIKNLKMTVSVNSTL